VSRLTEVVDLARCTCSLDQADTNCTPRSARLLLALVGKLGSVSATGDWMPRPGSTLPYSGFKGILVYGWTYLGFILRELEMD